MSQADDRGAQPSVPDVALIVGGGPGISSSCARLFAASGMRVAVAARNPDKPALRALETAHGARRYACDASKPTDVEQLFQAVVRDLGSPTLVVHNIDGRVPGIFRKGITEADPGMVLETLRNSAFSAFLVGQQAARHMRENATKRQRRERERSSSRTQAQRSRAFRRAAPSRWHVMPSPGSRKAWRGN